MLINFCLYGYFSRLETSGENNSLAYDDNDMPEYVFDDVSSDEAMDPPSPAYSSMSNVDFAENISTGRTTSPLVDSLSSQPALNTQWCV